jgi:hypothetical protein
MPMGVIAGVIGLFQVAKAGIELTQSFKNAFENSDPSRLTFGQAANNFTNAAQTFNQQLSSSTQERTEETADEKRRREQEQWQLDQHNQFNLQEQFTLPEFLSAPQETTYPT